MKKILSTLAIITFVSVLFTSCSKDKAQPVSERIVGTWHVDKLLYNEHYDGGDHTMSVPGGQNDTYEFTKDGTVNIVINSEPGSATYSIIGDKQLSVEDDTIYDIKQLDDHNLILYGKETDGDDFEEITLTLTR